MAAARPRRIDPDALLELALHALKTELAPHLPPDKRYAAAMLVNALEIARRGITGDAEAAPWEILDKLYDDGEGTPRQLAADIRASEIDDDSHPDLAARLRKLVLAELKITNPRVAKARATPTTSSSGAN